ncbi:MAG: hypothetical protein U0M42_01945 [Acutalibacteraceae bacterium]|nr:hypothetical protein [Acutalibacteraceae bacterium]
MADKNFFATLAELLSSNYDNKPTKTEEYAKQLVSVHEEFVKRNEKLTSLLDDYITQRKERVRTNNFLKKFIFWFFVGMLGALTITVVCFVAFNITIKTISAMVSLISVSATYLASLIGIFQIMSKYLFPVDEEKDTISMIKAVINNDVEVEKLMSTAIDKSFANDVEHLKLMKELRDSHTITQEEFVELKESILKKIKNN